MAIQGWERLSIREMSYTSNSHINQFAQLTEGGSYKNAESPLSKVTPTTIVPVPIIYSLHGCKGGRDDKGFSHLDITPLAEGAMTRTTMGKLNRVDAIKLGMSVDTTSKSMQLTADHINTCLFKSHGSRHRCWGIKTCLVMRRGSVYRSTKEDSQWDRFHHVGVNHSPTSSLANSVTINLPREFLTAGSGGQRIW